MIYIVAFILLLGVLVLAHELGHFLAGRLMKVKIEAFSIGFGKPILRKKVGDTEYRLSIVPLGGYVKFYGDDPKSDKPIPQEMTPYLFNNQKVWKRAFIVFSGPLANFLLAVLVFCTVYFIGEPNVSTKLGYVEKTSVAFDSGLREGDVIEAVNGTKVQTWTEMDELVSTKKDSVLLSVKRDEKNIEVKVPLNNLIAKNRYGETVHKEQIQGISPFKRSSLIGVDNSKNSIAYAQGLRTGDLVYKINTTEVNSWDEMQKALIDSKKDATIYVKRAENKGTKPKELELLVRDTSKLVLKPAELFISGFVGEDSPASKAGMQVGDMIYAVNNKQVLSFQSLQQLVDIAGRNSESLNVTVLRAGKLIELDITPALHDLKDEELGQKEKRYLLGVETNYYPGPVDQTKIIIRNPIQLIWAGIEKTAFWVWITAVGLVKLLTGAVSFKAVGGPLMIGKVAGDSLMMGFVYFFRIMAVISINLGVINLFPIPVLDGGHLVLYSIEAIRRKPLKERHIEIVQQVGFYLLIGLIVLSFYNDIIRFGSALLGLGGK
jgi:regulator of sigma E protease